MGFYGYGMLGWFKAFKAVGWVESFEDANFCEAWEERGVYGMWVRVTSCVGGLKICRVLSLLRVKLLLRLFY